MKLIIQIPCFNEEATLPLTLADLPKSIQGIKIIEVQVVDDGSTDQTSEVAKRCGVHHIVKLGGNRGLATAFKTGVENALRMGADIIVNTDADNQYCGKDISKLVEPILAGRADIVIGERPISDHPEFSPVKKLLQKIGSWVVRGVSRTTVPDTTSGFRAYSAEAAMRMSIFTRFSYCLETLIQAGYSGLKVETIPIRINPKTRESRLFKGIGQYVLRSSLTIIRVFIVYRASLFFAWAGVVPGLLHLILGEPL